MEDKKDTNKSINISSKSVVEKNTGDKKKLPVIIQHYISQGVLRLFSDNKKSIFEFNVKENKIYRAGISTTMSDKYTYEHPFLKGNALENAFKKIEDKYIPIITEIVNYLDKDNVAITKKILEGIMTQILLFYYRSGAMLFEFSDNNDFTKQEVIDNLIYRITDIRHLKKLADAIISDYSFVVVRSDEGRLALSDQYISTASLNCKGKITNLSNRTIGFSNCIIMIPLCARYYAIYYNGDFSLSKPIVNNRIYDLEKQDLLNINKVIIRNSYNKCIAMHQDELQEVKQFKSMVSGPIGTVVKYTDGKYRSYTVKKEVFYYDIDEDIFENYVKYYTQLVEFKKENGRVIGRNDLCLCGSGKKYKKCCYEKYTQAKFVSDRIQSDQTNWMCTKSKVVEKPINEFWGIEANLPKTPRSIIDGLRKTDNEGLII